MKKDPFKIFNVNEFKKWMENSPDGQSSENLIGLNASSKVSFKKLKMNSEALDSAGALMEFHKKGGEVIEESGEILTIKTKKGSIRVNRQHVVID